MSRSNAQREVSSWLGRWTPLTRLPVLEWLHQVRTGEIVLPIGEDVVGGGRADWAITSLDAPGSAEFSIHRAEGTRRFHHLPYSRLLPEELELASQREVAIGPNCVEAMELLFSSVEWLIESRAHLLDAASAVPSLLVSVVEAMGIDSSIHAWDSERLRLIVEALPKWLPKRGAVAPAIALINRLEELPKDSPNLKSPMAEPTPQAARRETITNSASIESSDKSGPVLLSITALDGVEIQLCRSLEWYAHRYSGGVMSREPLVIERGLAQQAPGLTASFPPTREDVMVNWEGAAERVPLLARLIPTWTSFRVYLRAGESRT